MANDHTDHAYDRRVDRKPRGEEVSRREVVLRLDGGQLVEVYRGPPRTPLPGVASALVCGAVRS